LSLLEISAIVYNLVFLCQHEEYSMREYAIHGLNKVFEYLKESKSKAWDIKSLVHQIEYQIVRVYLVTVKDELVLKTVLESLKSVIILISETNIDSNFDLGDLISLSKPNEEKEDFFSSFLSIKLRQR